ncbi:SWFGD domain-containing protein [uncultured Paracoccus sp.]|uniref:SWFGD domain-containing protein n=1 Tax=uncultured Paracoccus sp. TaxID=189685 RepID=UPI0025FFF4A3|nr:SWFGD domain-containing protein [uncultured Paracoccus sp.]
MADRWRNEGRDRWDRDDYRGRYGDEDRGYGRAGRYGDYGRGAYGTPYGDYSRRDDRPYRDRPYEEPGYLGGFGRASHYDRGIVDRERGWMDRAGDEVASWFGDEDAERRRDMDDMRDDDGRGRRGYGRRDAGPGGPRRRWRDDW